MASGVREPVCFVPRTHQDRTRTKAKALGGRDALHEDRKTLISPAGPAISSQSISLPILDHLSQQRALCTSNRANGEYRPSHRPVSDGRQIALARWGETRSADHVQNWNAQAPEGEKQVKSSGLDDVANMADVYSIRAWNLCSITISEQLPQCARTITVTAAAGR